MNHIDKLRIAEELRRFGQQMMEVDGVSCQVSGFIYDLNIFCRDFDLDMAEGMSEDPVAEEAWDKIADFIMASDPFLNLFGCGVEVPELKFDYGQFAVAFDTIRKAPEYVERMREVITKYSPKSMLLEETARALPFRADFESAVDKLIRVLRTEHGLA